jgi:hypothetical protein
MDKKVTKKKIHCNHLFAILVSILLIIGPTGCFWFEDCPDVHPYFSIQGLTISNVTFTEQPNNRLTLVEDNDTIQWDNFFMAIDFEKTFYSEFKTSGGQNLYALSCSEDGDAGTKVGADTVYVVTMQHYNEQYHQLDTLNNMVLTNYRTIIKDDFNDYFSMATYIAESKDFVRRDGFQVRFTDPPSEDVNANRFKLIFILKNGERFEAISDDIQLSK